MASKGALMELFDRIGCFFARLETYTEVAPTTAMTDIITKIMIEVLRIFAIATKEIRRGSASEFPIDCLWISTDLRIEKFLRKLAGMADLEAALKKLDRLTQEEAWMALAEVLKITNNVRDNVKVVDSKVERVEKKIEVMGDKVQDIGDKVQVIVDGVCGLSSQSLIPSNMYTYRRRAVKRGSEGSKLDYPTHGKRDRRKQVFVISQPRRCSLLVLNLITGNQLNQLLRAWLSPTDPSTNHIVAQKAQHMGTTAWFFQGRIVIEWKATGSLLWIYGKRVFLSTSFMLAPSDRLRLS